MGVRLSSVLMKSRLYFKMFRLLVYKNNTKFHSFKKKEKMMFAI
jgi:hypothetical protein